MDNVINSNDVFRILTEKQAEILNMSHNETRSALLELIFEITRKVSELPNISEEPLMRGAITKIMPQRDIEEISKFATPKTYNATCSACNEWIRTDDIYCRSCGAKLFVDKNAPQCATNTDKDKSSWIKCSDKLPDSFCKVLMHWEDDDIPDTIGVYAGTGVLGEMCFRAKGLRQYPNSYIIIPEESKESD